MILPKDLKQAIQTLIKYGGSEDNLKSYVSNLVNKELGIKPKKVSKPINIPQRRESDKQSESNGDVIFPTTNVDLTNYYYPTLKEIKRREHNKNNEPNEMQKELAAISMEDMDNDTHKVLLHLVHGGKYKIWLTAKQLAQLTLSETDHEAQTSVRTEIYKASNKGLIVQMKKNSKDRKNVIHYALNDEGMSYMNKQTIGVTNERTN